MKKIIIVLFLFSFAGCAGWQVNGIPTERFNTGGDWGYALLGMATSFGVHTLGHLAYLEMKNADWKIEGNSEVCYSELSNSEWRWFGRAGFVAQLLVGTIIKVTPLEKSTFATGYHIGSATEIITYPLIHNDSGDLYMINEYGGNARLEWLGYSSWATMLLITNKDR